MPKQGKKDGVVSSASDAIDISFNGVGAHGSMPDKGIDPIMMGSRFVTDVQSVISREKDPKAFGVITVGSEAIFVPASEAGGNASEDYSELVKAGIASVFFAIGGLDPALFAKVQADKTAIPVNHSPFFAPVPEATIKRGAEVLAFAALMALAEPGAGQ